MLKMVTADLPQFFFEYTANWWPYRHEPNVLLLHYKNLRKNMSEGVAQLAKFLDIPLSDELYQKVAYKTSIEYMKTKPERVCYRFGYPGNEFCHSNEHLNKGQADKGKDFFTEDMLQKWNDAEQRYWGENAVLKNWVAEGGQYE